MLMRLKKAVSTVLVLAVAGVFFPATAGCEKDEFHTTRQIEVKDKVVSQETVVE